MSATWEFPPYTQTIHRSSYPAIDPTNPSNSAKGKVVVVTGGGAGVGKGIASSFVLAGAKTVAILGRRENILASAKTELEKLGSSQILTYQADIVDDAALQSAFASIAKEAGPIDVVVANAGYLSTPAPLVTSDIDDWWKGFEVNIKGTALTFRAFAAHASQNKPVFIALNTGIAHGDIYPGFSSYAASKTGGAHLISFLQAEHPEMRIVSLHPGVLETDMATKSGVPLSRDEMSLPSDMAVWVAGEGREWTKGRFLWSNWDVEELEKMKGDIVEKDELRMVLSGWPKQGEAKVVA